MIGTMRAPVRSNSSAVGYSTWNDWPISASRVVPKMRQTSSLQSSILRSRDSTRPTGASWKAV